MRVRLDYGTGGLDVDVPSGAVVVDAHAMPPLPDPSSAIARALRSPLGAAPLAGLVRPHHRVVIALCDGTRPQPRREVLGPVLAALAHVPDDHILLIVATGTHRGNTGPELEAMLGREILDRHRVLNHDARNAAMLLPACVTSTGVEVLLNREFLAADVRITTGVVEPHFFAGFSGGPKMVAPGLAGLDTVLELHDAARIGHPRSTWGITEGNPIHDDVREIARRVGVHFAVDVTLDRDKAITGVFAGDPFVEHAAACERARAEAMRPLPRRFDVVVTSNSGYPLDQNLYQAVKGLSAAARAVKPGGTIVCASECRDGLPAHGSFADVLAMAPTPAGLLKLIEAPGFRAPDQWQVQILAGILEHARVMFKADGLTTAQLASAHIEAVDDVSAAVARAVAQAGPGATVCVLPQGPRVVPVLE